MQKEVFLKPQTSKQTNDIRRTRKAKRVAIFLLTISELYRAENKTSSKRSILLLP